MAEERLQRIAVGERIAAGLGQLVDVVAGGPDLHAAAGAQNDDVDAIALHLRQTGHELIHKEVAEAVQLILVVEGQRADFAVDRADDELRGRSIGGRCGMGRGWIAHAGTDGRHRNTGDNWE
jgi:hypothetical protein